ncbi:MAG TPA: hypothetical protein VFA68_03865 [Terriglobales bacterium]|nr:hypothetical protein [Terriglobales bacterium]
MEIKAHLTEEEMAQAWFEPGRGIAAHLENCEICRAELRRLRQAVQADETPAVEFWETQRQKIWQQIETARPPSRNLGWRWGLAFASLLLLAATLSMSSGNRPPRPAETRSQTQFDPDHELLLEVERIVQANGPLALQPAGLMTETQLNQDTNVVNQEGSHAN